MNKIDAVFLDLDGTLLNSKKVVSQKNKQVLMHCMNSGIDVYIVSGRPIFYVDQIADSIDQRCSRVAFNGAVYKINGEVFKTNIDIVSLKNLWDNIQKNSIQKYYLKGMDTVYCSDDDVRFTYEDLENEGKIKVYRNIESFDRIHTDIYKVLLVDEDDDRLNALKQECDAFVSITSSHIKSFDIMANHINKGDVVKKICKEQQYKSTIAVGDDMNDISMLEVVDYGYAMKNASKYLLGKTKYMTEYTNEEDGVAEAILKYVD